MQKHFGAEACLHPLLQKRWFLAAVGTQGEASVLLPAAIDALRQTHGT